MKITTFLSILALFSSINAYCQENSSLDQAAKRTEFAIPASPAFNMLNENVPSRIQRYASLHDFKVDWSMTNGQSGYSLSPGIALEAQPVWLLLFDRAGGTRYRSATPLTRMLSTLSLSLGTTASNDKNWLAWGAKLNLYRQHDPLKDQEFLMVLDKAFNENNDTLRLVIKELEKQQIMLRRNANDYDQRMNLLDDSIATLELAIRNIERMAADKVSEAREQYVQAHWNSNYLDIAFGRLMTYNQVRKELNKSINDPLTGRDSIISLSNNSLELKAQGYGVWLSGGIGIGKYVQLSAMTRYGKRPSATANNVSTDLASLGVNLRYGTKRYNFFAEGFFDHSRTTFSDFEGASITQKLYVMTFGGDWRLSRNVMLSFGIRQTRDYDSSIYLLQPLINVNCLMR